MMQQKCPNIPAVFAEADVFITGGTGFMGKVLIEKLLRSCPQIARVFVLMRAKRGKSLEDRLKLITDGVVCMRLQFIPPLMSCSAISHALINVSINAH